MNSSIRTLLTLRRSAWRHQLSHFSPKNNIGLWISIALLIVILLYVGHANVELFVEPPKNTAMPTNLQPRSNLVRGARALEIAFWLTALASTLSSFRIMELLFRRKDVRQLQYLPLPIETYFVDRVLYGLAEVIALSALTSVLFVPMLWHGHGWVALSCVLMCFGGLLATFCAGFGIQLYAGHREYGHYSIQGEHEPAMAAGQLFIFAPGMALLFSMILNLFLKLGLGEVIRLSKFARPTWLALGVAAACSVAGLIIGFAYFKRCYFRILAGFREADFMGFQVQVDYQTSAYDQRTRWGKLVMETGRGIYQRHQLQFARRHLLMRYMYGMGWLLFGLAVWQFDATVFPDWGALGVVYLLLAILVHPWSKLDRPGLHTPAIHALPIEPRAEQSAWAWFSLREALLFGAPMLLLLLGLRAAQNLENIDTLLTILLTSLTGLSGLIALHGVQMVIRKLSTQQLFGVVCAVLTAMGLIATSAISTVAGLIVCLVLGIATIMYHLSALSGTERTTT